MIKLKRKLLKMYMNKQLKNEKIFDNGECKIKHLLIKNNNSDKLLVVFSGFPAGNTPTYNYVLKFKNLKYNKLFILDDLGDDPRGTYYLGKDKDFFIERAVSQLIDKTTSKFNVDKNNVYTAGSSKGGFAALYYAYKHGYGKVFAGAPQVLLGNYLTFHARRNIMTYISGNDNNTDIDYLNKLLPDVIEKSEYKPDTHIYISKSEDHYEEHVIPLTNMLREKNLSYNLEIASYENHGDVGKGFPSYVLTKI